MRKEVVKMVLSGVVGAGVFGAVQLLRELEDVPAEAGIGGVVIGSVDGTAFGGDDLIYEMSLRGVTNEKGRASVAKEMVERKLLAAAALKAGIGARPDVKRRYELLLGRAIREDWEGRGSAPAGLPIDGLVLQQHYNANLEAFRIPGRSRVAMIFVRDEGRAQSGRGVASERVMRAREAAVKAAGSKEFARVVLEYSDDQATRYRGGDLGYLVEGMTGEAFSPGISGAIFALQHPGDCTEVFECEGGHRFFRLTDRQVGSVRPFREVRGELRRQLEAERDSANKKAFVAESTDGIPSRLDWGKIRAIPLPLGRVDEPEIQVGFQDYPKR